MHSYSRDMNHLIPIHTFGGRQSQSGLICPYFRRSTRNITSTAKGKLKSFYMQNQELLILALLWHIFLPCTCRSSLRHVSSFWAPPMSPRNTGLFLPRRSCIYPDTRHTVMCHRRNRLRISILTPILWWIHINSQLIKNTVSPFLQRRHTNCPSASEVAKPHCVQMKGLFSVPMIQLLHLYCCTSIVVLFRPALVSSSPLMVPPPDSPALL